MENSNRLDSILAAVLNQYKLKEVAHDTNYDPAKICISQRGDNFWESVDHVFGIFWNIKQAKFIANQF